MSIALGLIAGITWTAPLWGWSLPESAMKVIGPMCGALIGAGAAVLITEFREARSDMAACRTVAEAIREGMKPVEDIYRILENGTVRGPNAPSPSNVRKLCEKATDDLNFGIKRIELLKSLAVSMKHGKGIAIADAEHSFGRLMKQLEMVAQAATREGTYVSIAVLPEDLGAQKSILAGDVGLTWVAQSIQYLEPDLIVLSGALRRLGSPGQNAKDLYANQSTKTA
jgi:hypothetical protein